MFIFRAYITYFKGSQGKPPKPPLILEHILSQNINMAKGFCFWWYLEPTSSHSKMGVGGETFLNINLCVWNLVSYHFVCTVYKPSVALIRPTCHKPCHTDTWLVKQMFLLLMYEGNVHLVWIGLIIIALGWVLDICFSRPGCIVELVLGEHSISSNWEAVM